MTFKCSSVQTPGGGIGLELRQKKTKPFKSLCLQQSLWIIMIQIKLQLVKVLYHKPLTMEGDWNPRRNKLKLLISSLTLTNTLAY
jgi:hypothetical protein